MKKTICLIIAVCMLLCIMPVFTSAASPDVDFSIDGAEGSAGDTVRVKVNLTKNPGIWAARFTVHFDASVLILDDVVNGTVFKNGEFVKSKLDFDGYYIYYAQLDSFGQNTYNEGNILTLTFRISDTAEPGDYNVYLDFPDHGRGWFFDGENPSTDYTVPTDGAVSAKVAVSKAKYIIGDVNGDGKVNAVDVNLMKQIALGACAPDSKQVITCDLNSDGKINAVDINLLKSLVLGG